MKYYYSDQKHFRINANDEIFIKHNFEFVLIGSMDESGNFRMSVNNFCLTANDLNELAAFISVCEKPAFKVS